MRADESARDNRKHDRKKIDHNVWIFSKEFDNVKILEFIERKM